MDCLKWCLLEKPMQLAFSIKKKKSVIKAWVKSQKDKEIWIAVEQARL